MRLQLYLIKREQSLILARTGRCLVIFCDLDAVLVLVSVLYDYGMVLSLSCSIIARQWPCVMLLFCAIVQQNTNAEQ